MEADDEDEDESVYVRLSRDMGPAGDAAQAVQVVAGPVTLQGLGIQPGHRSWRKQAASFDRETTDTLSQIGGRRLVRATRLDADSGPGVCALTRVASERGRVTRAEIGAALKTFAAIVWPIWGTLVVGPDLVAAAGEATLERISFGAGHLDRGWWALPLTPYNTDLQPWVWAATPASMPCSRAVPRLGASGPLTLELTGSLAGGVNEDVDRAAMTQWGGEVVRRHPHHGPVSLGYCAADLITLCEGIVDAVDGLDVDAYHALDAVTADDDLDDELDLLPDGLGATVALHLDRIVLDPCARGHGVGALVLRTLADQLGRHAAVAVMQPAPLTDPGAPEGNERREDQGERAAGRARLHAYWRAQEYSPVPRYPDFLYRSLQRRYDRRRRPVALPALDAALGIG